MVSGVDATSIRSIFPARISSDATSAARLGFDWLSLMMSLMGWRLSPIATPSLSRLSSPAMMKVSASANPASGPVRGLT